MADKQHLYLVDGSAYIFRAYHRLPPLTNPEGTPVGAVYGYTTMLWKLAEDLNKADGPTHLAVVLDKSSHSFRNEDLNVGAAESLGFELVIFPNTDGDHQSTAGSTFIYC